MSVALRRRMDAIQGKLAPKPRKSLVVVYTPLPDDPPEEWERYRQEMAVDADMRIIVEYVEESIP